MIAPGATALAAETTTGYNQTPPAPKTETTKTTTTTPTTTTTTTPAKHEVAPTQTSTTPTGTQEARPTATTTTPRAATLPFTGLDLRWVIAAGVFLLGAGLSIVFVQRGRRGPVS